MPSKDQQITVVQKPLRRGNDFFFSGYVHDVSVSEGDDDEHVVVCAKYWASQAKKKKYAMTSTRPRR